MDLSVIIPTRLRPDFLKGALGSLAAQSFGRSRFEVIVVDNGPSPESAGVVASFAGSLPNLRYIPEPAPGLHNARHRGMREAVADFLVYADDDIEAFPEWLEGVWQGFTRHGAVLVGGRNLPKWEAEPPAWLRGLWAPRGEGERVLGYLSILDFGEREKEIDPSYVWGCNFSIRREVLLEAGGFHPDGVPEELLHLRGDGESHVSRFIAARGYRAFYIPSASVHHLVPRGRMTFDYFRKRAFAQGISDSFSHLRRHPAVGGEVRVKWHPLGRLMARPWLRRRLRHLLPAGVYARASLNQAYWEGFMWHLDRFSRESELREWVLREQYMGEP